jgi:hypothetical protein
LGIQGLFWAFENKNKIARDEVKVHEFAWR